MKTDDLAQALRKLLDERDRSTNAAFDLWTWLPSYQAAVFCHGDGAYGAYSRCPRPDEVLREAAKYIALISDDPDAEMHGECPCCGGCIK